MTGLKFMLQMRFTWRVNHNGIRGTPFNRRFQVKGKPREQLQTGSQKPYFDIAATRVGTIKS